MRLRDRAFARASAGMGVVAIAAGQVELAQTLMKQPTATLAGLLQPGVGRRRDRQASNSSLMKRGSSDPVLASV